MNENYNLNDLFHPKVDIGNQNPTNFAEYNPSADKGQNGVYQAVVRFVTWYKNPNNSLMDKWVCWLEDPVTERGRSIDCPTSVGKPSILQDMYFKLKKSESIQEQKKADVFSRRHQYAAIVQVIQDKQNPDLVGKLLVWKFGKKVWEKLDAEKKPIVGDPNEPFDLLDGKAFALIITKVAGFNNYDQSKFLDKRIPLMIPRADGSYAPINSSTPKEDVFNFLKENSPDLDKYGYREWDSEINDYVNQVIVAVTGQNHSSGFANVRNADSAAQKYATPGATPGATQGSGITSQEISLDSMSSPSFGDLSDLDLPDINTSLGDSGLLGNLDEAFEGL